jgi:hypothetical protein
VDKGPALLDRIRTANERIWADPYPGLGWQPGTRWRGGMTDAEVAQAEERYGVRFPPDYRLLGSQIQ